MSVALPVSPHRAKQKIAIKKLNALVFGPAPAVAYDSVQGASTIATSMLSLGYVPSRELFTAMAAMPEEQLIEVHRDVIGILQELKGAHVKHQPMYPNFPQQVIDASHLELFSNAILHYWTVGEWRPTYEVLPREYYSEETKFWEIGLTTDEQFRDIFRQLLGSNDSLSDEDKGYIEWFMLNEPNLSFPNAIPFKENMCVVAGMFIKAGMQPDELMHTATDVLRVITYLNDGDVSLAAKTKYKSLPRSQRRMFAKLLNKHASEEDVHRHRGKWTRVFHSLHIGEFKKRFPDICAIAAKIRNNETIRTFNGRVDMAITARLAENTIEILKTRPGEFARRLDHLFRIFGDTDDAKIIGGFLEIADKIPTRILMQVMGHLQTRDSSAHKALKGQGRVVFPKGHVQKARILPAADKPLNDANVAALRSGIEGVLVDRFAAMPTLGKVYLDPELMLCPIPSQQRSASEGMFNVARGTRLPFGDPSKTTLRFFIHWVNPGVRSDLDLSATLYDDQFNFLDAVTYYTGKSDKYQAHFSGDETNAPAPRGASEFIDITLSAAQKGVRYVVMDVRCYTGTPFSKHEECFAGWMTREEPNSNEIFDAKTVEAKVDLRNGSRNAIPAVFDLVERKAIWCDVSGSSHSHRSGNNVASNKASIKETLRAIVQAANKVSLYKLFELHAKGRGEMVESPEEADTIFSLNQGITPYDINTISSDFLA